MSARACQALASAKARGFTLGNPQLHKARKTALKTLKSETDRYANVLPIIREDLRRGPQIAGSRQSPDREDARY